LRVKYSSVCSTIVVVWNVVNANPPKTVVPAFAIAAAVVYPTKQIRAAMPPPMEQNGR
jgi:hypothetical protein